MTEQKLNLSSKELTQLPNIFKYHSLKILCCTDNYLTTIHNLPA